MSVGIRPLPRVCGCLPLVAGFYVACAFTLARTALVLYLYAGVAHQSHYVSWVQAIGVFCTVIAVPLLVMAIAGEALRLQQHVRNFAYCTAVSGCHDAAYLLQILVVGAGYSDKGPLPELMARLTSSSTLNGPVVSELLASAIALAYLSLVFYAASVIWSLAESLGQDDLNELLPRHRSKTAMSSTQGPSGYQTMPGVGQGFLSPSAGRQGAFALGAATTCDPRGPPMVAGQAARGNFSKPSGPFPSLFAGMKEVPRF